MPRVYLGLGANLGNPPAQLRAALARIAQLPGTSLAAQSSFYRSAPLGPSGQSDYCNAVAAIETTLAPERLLEQLHAIEAALGRRQPRERWSARPIDLDILLYEGVTGTSGALTIPHPELHKRNFVVVPLAEVAPELEIPGHGRVAALAAKLGWGGLSLWPEAKI